MEPSEWRSSGWVGEISGVSDRHTRRRPAEGVLAIFPLGVRVTLKFDDSGLRDNSLDRESFDLADPDPDLERARGGIDLEGGVAGDAARVVGSLSSLEGEGEGEREE